VVKDISRRHFKTLTRRGYDVQRIWGARYDDEYPDVLYLDFKQYSSTKKMRNLPKDEPVLYDYTRYVIYIPNEWKNFKELDFMTIRKPEDFDYDRFFIQMGCGKVRENSRIEKELKNLIATNESNEEENQVVVEEEILNEENNENKEEIPFDETIE
jgi:hypothetical protein